MNVPKINFQNLSRVFWLLCIFEINVSLSRGFYFENFPIKDFNFLFCFYFNTIECAVWKNIICLPIQDKSGIILIK